MPETGDSIKVGNSRYTAQTLISMARISFSSTEFKDYIVNYCKTNNVASASLTAKKMLSLYQAFLMRSSRPK